MELLAVVALVLAGVAVGQAGASRRKVEELARRLARLESSLLRAGEPGSAPLPPGEPARPAGPAVWPEDLSLPSAATPDPPAPRPERGPSLWAPEFSRARISVAGGLLVLGGLSFTLRALGAPAWTLLLAVFGFGGLLYFNARRVPWPVSGALRGLGYGVAALGLGSLSQRLPDGWGPAAVLAGLLLLSAALLWDSWRRREPLLGALAVSGAALSTWMLTDDLGRASIPAAGLALLLAAAAVWWGRAPGRGEAPPVWPEAEPERRAAQRAALPLTLGVAGAVPLGWLVASLSHLPAGRWLEPGRALVAALQLDSGFPALLPWLVFSVLALGVPLALRSRLPGPDDPPARPGDPDVLGAAWATLIPQTLVALAVGAALSGARPPAAELACALGALLAVGLAAWLAWRRPAPDRDLLGAAVAGGLTAGAAGLAGSVALSLLGPRTEALALGGIALALLWVGLYGRSRFWLRVGALGLGGAAFLGTGRSLEAPFPLDTGAALLGAAPALLAVLAALRLGRVPWALWPAAPEASGGRAGWTAPLVAALGSALTAMALVAGGTGLLGLGCVLGAAGLFWLAGPGRRGMEPAARLTALLAAAPGLVVGALDLLVEDGGAGVGPGVGVALLAGGALYVGARALEPVKPGGATPTAGLMVAGLLAALAELASLGLVALGLGRASQEWWPALGVPGALALTALLSVPLPWRWPWAGRLDFLLGLAALALLTVLASAPAWRPAVPALGGALVLGVWALTRTATGLERLGRWLRLPAPHPAQGPVPRTLWAAGLLALVLLLLGGRLGGFGAGLRPWAVLSSLAVLLVGIHACVQARRAAGEPSRNRRWWDTGLVLIVLAGGKGALLDAARWPNPAAALGLAVLVTGLSLLAVAILAPRPGPGAAPAA